MSESRVQDVVSRLEGKIDPEMFEKGYTVTVDPGTNVVFGGMNHPSGEWRSVHVSVGLNNNETVQWLRERNMLSYDTVYSHDSQVVTDPSFVLGSILAAIELKQASRKSAAS